MITRRGVLLGAMAAVGGAVLDGCGSDYSPATALQTGSFVSRERGGARTGWAILRPNGSEHARLPVLVVLHGRGGDHTDAYRSVHLDRALAAHVRAGGAPFAIASVDGGDHEYWHPRRSTDAAGMVVREFVPLLSRRGLDVGRIALLGWSMGGYGALYLAGVLGHVRVAAAVAESPALWRTAGESAAGAFDDAADFDQNAIFGHLDRLAGIALRVDCGASDGFAPITRALRAALRPTPAGGIEPGAHDATYWGREAPAQLAFVARHLT